MELLQLIFSVIAGLGAGALGALLVTRRDKDADREQSISERLQELEHQNAKNLDRLEQLSEFFSAADRDLRNQLQAGLVARDERLEAVHERIKQTERALDRTPAPTPPQRLQVRLDDTAGRVEVVESAVGRLERRIQAKLIAFREGTQEVLRKLAEHQVEEAERVTQLTKETEVAKERLEALGTLSGDSRSTTAALVEVMESQVALTQRSSELESRFTDGMRQLARHMMDLEARLSSVDALRVQLQAQPPKIIDETRLPDEQGEAQAPAVPPTMVAATAIEAEAAPDDLEQIFGIGPKLAARLRTHDVPDIRALAVLTDQDLQRLGREIKGFKDRQARHDWVGQARRVLAERGESTPAPAEANGAEPPETARANGHVVDEPSAPVDSAANGRHAAQLPSHPKALPSSPETMEANNVDTQAPPPTAPPMWPVPTAPADPDAIR